MRLGRADRLWGDFKVINGGQATKTLFKGGVDPSRHHVKIGGGLGWMKWLKNGAGKLFIFYAVIPPLYPFW